jgi:23S rRNA pseudouridine2605 synthase
MTDRLQKVLANAGFGSRRQIEQWIREGRIRINGRLAQLGDQVSEDDRIKIDGRPVSEKRLHSQQKHHVIMYNKPEGEIVSRHDEKGRASVFDHLPALEKGRWIAVGRLDLNSSGLMIFTTHGELANRLMHPSRQIEREYAVRVHGHVSDEQLEQLVTGVELEDGFARFEEIVDSGGEGSNHWYHVVIMEGRKREVRRLWEAIGVQVNRLKRVRFGPLFLNSAVKAGQWRSLNREELRQLSGLTEISRDQLAVYAAREYQKPVKRARENRRRRS